MRIVCWQTILMKYHTLFFSKIRKDVTKFVVCCSHDWCFKRLRYWLLILTWYWLELLTFSWLESWEVSTGCIVIKVALSLVWFSWVHDITMTSKWHHGDVSWCHVTLCCVWCYAPTKVLILYIRTYYLNFLTINAPIATKVVCFSGLLKCLRSLYGKQCGPRTDCSYRSSLFWVHAVCFYT